MENKKKILIIEDDVATRKVLKEALQKDPDLEVWEAEDGNKGLDIVQKFLPDLAIVDINIPGIDGITLVRLLSDQQFDEKNENIVSDQLKRDIENLRRFRDAWRARISHKVRLGRLRYRQTGQKQALEKAFAPRLFLSS